MSKLGDILFEFYNKMTSYTNTLEGEEYRRMRDLAYEETKERIIEYLVHEIRSQKWLRIKRHEAN